MDPSNPLLAFLEDLGPWQWLIIGVLLLIFELFTGSLFILWPALAALIVGLVMFVIPLSWEMQLVLFAILTAAGLFYGEKYLRPRLKKDTSADDLNDRAKIMVGRRVTAVANFVNGDGRVDFGDTQWKARLENDTVEVTLGQTLEIASVDGATLIVTPLE